MPELVPLVPFALPFLCAGLVALSQRHVPERYRPMLLPAMILVIEAAFLLEIGLLPHAFRLVPQGGISPALVLRLDWVSLVPLLLFLNGVLVAAATGNLSSEVGTTRELVWLGFALPAFFAGNLLSLLGAWFLADVTLLLHAASRDSAQVALRSVISNQLAVALLVLVVVLGGADALDLNSESLLLSDLSGALLLVALGVRLGLFPFHVGWPVDLQEKTFDPLWQFLLPLAIGVAGLGRAIPWLPDSFAYTPWLWAWIVVALVLPVVATLGARYPNVLMWATSSVVTLAVAAPLVAERTTRLPLVFGLGTGLLSSLPLFVGAIRLNLGAPHLHWSRLLWLAGILTLGGAPLTPGFLARTTFYLQALTGGMGPFLALATLIALVALAALYRQMFLLVPERRRSLRLIEALGIVLAFLPVLVFAGFTFINTGGLGSRLGAAAAALYIPYAIPDDPARAVLVLSALLLPLIVAAYIGYSWSRSTLPIEEWSGLIAQPLLFHTILRQMLLGLDQLSRLARAASALFEEHVLGWLIFAALWIAIYLSTLR